MAKAEAEALLQFDKVESQLPAVSEVHFELYEPKIDRDRLRDLAVWCRRFSPVVGVEDANAPECLLINIEGTTHLFKNERAMARHVLEELQKIKLHARVAIADSVGMSWAAAHYRQIGGQSSKQNSPIIVSMDETQRILESLPSAALRLPDEVMHTLNELDLNRVSQLLSLPRATLPSRFGDILHKRIGQILGDIPEPITPELPRKPTSERWRFEYVISDRRVVEMAIARLLERTIASLEPDRQGIQRLHIILQGELGELTDFTVGLIRPSLSHPHLMRLVRTQLDRVRTPDDICEIRVDLISSAPLDPRQETLFACRDESKAGREREQLFERISSRLGENAVVRADRVPDSQPELAFRYDPIVHKPASKIGFESRCEILVKALARPLSLKLKPKPIDVLAVSNNGPPASVRWNGSTHPVTKSHGPERIHTGWWRDDSVVRDYYRIETSRGLRLWLFRDVRRGEWFLHGVFD